MFWKIKYSINVILENVIFKISLSIQDQPINIFFDLGWYPIFLKRTVFPYQSNPGGGYNPSRRSSLAGSISDLANPTNWVFFLLFLSHGDFSFTKLCRMLIFDWFFSLLLIALFLAQEPQLNTLEALKNRHIKLWKCVIL